MVWIAVERPFATATEPMPRRAPAGACAILKLGVSLRDLQQLMVDPRRSWRTASSSGGLRIGSGSRLSRVFRRGRCRVVRLGDHASVTGLRSKGSCSCPTPGAAGETCPNVGCGSGRTVWRRLRKWQDAGVWDDPVPTQ